MRLLFKQRIFSWLDSYDIYDENNEVLYTVKGELSWGHKLSIYNHIGVKVGEVKEVVLSFLPCFVMYVNEIEIGIIKKKFSFFKPKFHLTCNDWTIDGDIWEWEYDVNSHSNHIMHASKDVWNFSDTYVIDIEKEENALYCLMIVLAIDAAKCSRSD